MEARRPTEEAGGRAREEEGAGRQANRQSYPKGADAIPNKLLANRCVDALRAKSEGLPLLGVFLFKYYFGSWTYVVIVS